MYMKIFKLVLKFLSFNIYPKRLLPVHGNEIIIRENINLDSFLCRRVEDQVNLKDSEGRLSPNAIDPEGEYFKLSQRYDLLRSIYKIDSEEQKKSK